MELLDEGVEGEMGHKMIQITIGIADVKNVSTTMRGSLGLYYKSASFFSDQLQFFFPKSSIEAFKLLFSFRLMMPNRGKVAPLKLKVAAPKPQDQKPRLPRQWAIENDEMVCESLALNDAIDYDDDSEKPANLGTIAHQVLAAACDAAENNETAPAEETAAAASSQNATIPPPPHGGPTGSERAAAAAAASDSSVSESAAPTGAAPDVEVITLDNSPRKSD